MKYKKQEDLQMSQTKKTSHSSREMWSRKFFKENKGFIYSSLDVYIKEQERKYRVVGSGSGYHRTIADDCWADIGDIY